MTKPLRGLRDAVVTIVNKLRRSGDSPLKNAPESSKTAFETDKTACETGKTAFETDPEAELLLTIFDEA
ncbi:MAG: hypothetical protein JOY96_08385 [Verrucomicrobia bacterium]|nr:hypothetical protein [Verrucomicrobiota bacterium]